MGVRSALGTVSTDRRQATVLVLRRQYANTLHHADLGAIKNLCRK